MKILTDEEITHVDRFFNEIVAVYLKYGLALSHEDTEGSFIVKKYCISLEDWLKDAQIEIENLA